MNALDRTVIGHHLAGAGLASDILLGVLIVLPLVLQLLQVARGPDGGRLAAFGADVLMLAVVMGLNDVLQAACKLAVRRPRPLTYDAGAVLADRLAATATYSFYSGHAAQAFGMATAYSYLYTLRHRGQRTVIPLWLSSLALAATVALLRVAAGQHFYSDVAAGAVVGSGVGLLVSSLRLGGLRWTALRCAARYRWTALRCAARYRWTALRCAARYRRP